MRASASSVSPNSCRRSEWPTIAPATPRSASIGIDTSPVNAPDPSSWTFCAQISIPLPAARSVAAASDVYGGHTTTSAAPSSETLPVRALRKASASPVVLFIFQFAATRDLRIAQHLHAGQLLALHQLQRRAAAGR